MRGSRFSEFLNAIIKKGPQGTLMCGFSTLSRASNVGKIRTLQNEANESFAINCHNVLETESLSATVKLIPRTHITNMTARTQLPAFAFLCAVSILFWWHPLVTTLWLALSNDAYTHIILILPLSAALIYTDWKYVDSKQTGSPALRIDTQPSPRLGASLLALALLISAYARWGM